MPAVQLEKKYQQALAECSGGSPSVSAYVAAVNFELAALARQTISGSLPKAQYVLLSRDCGRKLRHGLRAVGWVDAWLIGDDDRDLVPNSFDRCPGTAANVPTNIQGCLTTQPVPPEPPADIMKKIFDRMGFMVNPKCADSPLPMVPAPTATGFEFPFPAFLIGVNHPDNQAAGCEMHYEVRIRFSDPIEVGTPAETVLGVVFNRAENSNTSSSKETFQIFRIDASGNGPRKLMYDTASKYRKKQILVKAMNGAGLTPGFSGALPYNETFFKRLQMYQAHHE